MNKLETEKIIQFIMPQSEWAPQTDSRGIEEITVEVLFALAHSPQNQKS